MGALPLCDAGSSGAGDAVNPAEVNGMRFGKGRTSDLVGLLALPVLPYLFVSSCFIYASRYPLRVKML